MTNFEWEEKKRGEDAHERQVQVLFGNESFAIGALQTVSAATSFGIISQLKPLGDAVGHFPVKIAFTGTVTALVLSLLAALFRHEYKKWDVKARAAKDQSEWQTRHRRSTIFLRSMRAFMWFATLLVVVSLLALVAGMWLAEPVAPAT